MKSILFLQKPFNYGKLGQEFGIVLFLITHSPGKVSDMWTATRQAIICGGMRMRLCLREFSQVQEPKSTKSWGGAGQTALPTPFVWMVSCFCGSTGRIGFRFIERR